MSALPQGWYPDPFGRYAQRYWDGDQWTARVSTDDVEQVDPLGVTTSIPFAIPSTAYTVDDATRTCLADEEARRRRRRWITIGVTLIVAAAVLVTIAVLAF